MSRPTPPDAPSGPQRVMRLAAPLLALALAASPALAEPTALQARERLRRQWLGHSLPATAPGLAKPDDAGIYDLTRLSAVLPIDGPRLPDRGRFELTLEVLAPFGTVLPLVALNYAPSRITLDGRELAFDRFADSGELIIELGVEAVPGQTLTLVMDVDLAPVCDDPTGCIAGGPFLHLVEIGWFPLSVEFPLTDRFNVALTLEVSGGVGVAAVGARAPIERGPGLDIWRFETERPTILPALAVGDFTLLDARERVEVYAPIGAGPTAFALGDLAEAVAESYSRLYVPYPFSRLGLTPISSEAGVALGPQANILLPEVFYFIDVDDPVFETVRQTVAHEIGHQYFFNLVGVLDAEEAWLSEAFAEYSATRFDAEVTGAEAHRRTNSLSYLYGVPARDDAPIYGQAVRANPFYFEIVYLKGSSVIHMLRQAIGADDFDEALRAYVRAFSGQLATTPELEQSLTASTGQRVSAFFDGWVRQAGFPTLQVRATAARRDNDAVRLDIVAEGPGPRPYPGEVPVRLDRPGDTSAFVLASLTGGEVRAEGQNVQRVVIDPELTALRRVRPEPAADVDLTGVVDGRDYLDVRFARGLAVPDPAFPDQLDVTDDGVIDEADVRAVRAAFGEGW